MLTTDLFSKRISWEIGHIGCLASSCASGGAGAGWQQQGWKDWAGSCWRSPLVAHSSMPSPCRPWVCHNYQFSLFSLQSPWFNLKCSPGQHPSVLQEEEMGEPGIACCCSHKRHVPIPPWAGQDRYCKGAKSPLWGPRSSPIDPLGNEALCPPSALKQAVISHGSASTSWPSPPLLTFFFFFVLLFLSLFLPNSYLFSNLPQEISTLIGSQQNKKERKTQYLKDEYLGESISLLMSWFQSGLFAIYMSIITIYLGTAVLLLRRRFLTAL